jgi:hypothetical protein
VALRAGAEVARAREATNIPAAVVLNVLLPDSLDEVQHIELLDAIEEQVNLMRPAGVLVVVNDMAPKTVIHMKHREPRSLLEKLGRWLIGRECFDTTKLELG